jgi:hypothetical protein
LAWTESLAERSAMVRATLRMRSWALAERPRRPWAREIHIVLDNLSVHKTQAVTEFFEANSKVRL